VFVVEKLWLDALKALIKVSADRGLGNAKSGVLEWIILAALRECATLRAIRHFWEKTANLPSPMASALERIMTKVSRHRLISGLPRLLPTGQTHLLS
jgi:hypothetical protein